MVERPAIALLGQLGWETANCFDVVFSDNGGTITARQLFGGQQRKKCNRRPADAGRRKISVYTWQTSLPTIYSLT